MTLRCIDIETTGINPSRDAIIEIASVDLQRDTTITNFQETLVRPSIAVPAVASAIHHLIDADLANAPPLEQVIYRFKGADAYVAHNCSFERSFLAPLLGDTIWICTTNARYVFGPGLRRTAIKPCATTLALLIPSALTVPGLFLIEPCRMP